MPSKASPRINYSGADAPASTHRRHMTRLEREFFRPLTQILTTRRMMMGLSQAELNDMIECADNHLSKWEAGLHRPSLYFLLLWCEKLNYQLTLKDIPPCQGS